MRKSNEKRSFKGVLEAYKLWDSFKILMVVIMIFIGSLFLYSIKAIRQDEVMGAIASGFFTSLLVTIIAMIVELMQKYNLIVGDEFIEDIHAYGIDRLEFDKETALRKELEACKEIIWISGYRFILTKTILDDIEKALQRGACAKVVACPPWTNTFRMVYGEKERVMNNYYEVFNVIINCDNPNDIRNEIRFTEKPLFSDTYRVDNTIISGPYMHNKVNSTSGGRITAKDFFSFYLTKSNSKLYRLLEDEYKDVINEAELILDPEKFKEAYRKYLEQDLTEAEKIKNLKEACIASSISVYNCDQEE